MFNHVWTGYDFPVLLREDSYNGNRLYITPEGYRYPSVTTVLSDYKKKELMEWRQRVGEQKANQISSTAARRGTAVHKVLEMYLKNQSIEGVEMMPNVKSLFYRMKKEVDAHVNNIHCLEQSMFSHEYKIAGTVDCIAEHKGVLAVIDFKTSNRLKKKDDIANYFMQAAAYRQMYYEATNLMPKKVVILIGVDTAQFCQTLVVNESDLEVYKTMLLEYIRKYKTKNNLPLN